jgi:hypothetical protein
MNWEAISAIGEIVGSIAVVVTLIYLAMQIRQTNNISQFNAVKELLKQFDDIYSLLATDPATRQVLAKQGELTEDEREHLYAFTVLYCNKWVSLEIAFRNGQIEEELYTSMANDVSIAIQRWPKLKPQIELWIERYPVVRNYKIFQTIYSDDYNES